MRTLVEVVRALGRESWLDLIAPIPSINPLTLTRAAAPRQRASKPRAKRPIAGYLRLTDYREYERLCSALLAGAGYEATDPLGGTGDEGRDTIIRSDSEGRKLCSPRYPASWMLSTRCTVAHGIPALIHNEPTMDMHQRLKDVIDQLYHPALQNGRQVFALSQTEAEQLPRLPTVAIISITSPGRPSAALDEFEQLLRLEFEDVDFLNKALSVRAKEKLPGSFTDNQAKLIRNFVENLPASVHTIITHCGGGFSRSCAVASCLNRLYGYRVEADRLQQANPSVVQVLMRSPKEQQVQRSAPRGRAAGL